MVIEDISVPRVPDRLEDIRLTHRVLKNFFTLFAQFAIDGVEARPKTDSVSVIRSAEQEIDKLADIPDFRQTPAERRSQPATRSAEQRAGSLGMHHFQGNAAASSSSLSAAGPAESILNDLVALVQRGGRPLRRGQQPS